MTKVLAACCLVAMLTSCEEPRRTQQQPALRQYVPPSAQARRPSTRDQEFDSRGLRNIQNDIRVLRDQTQDTIERSQKKD